MATLARFFSELEGVKNFFLLDFQEGGESASESGGFFHVSSIGTESEPSENRVFTLCSY